jgi:hypothetical protein
LKTEQSTLALTREECRRRRVKAKRETSVSLFMAGEGGCGELERPPVSEFGGSGKKKGRWRTRKRKWNWAFKMSW